MLRSVLACILLTLSYALLISIYFISLFALLLRSCHHFLAALGSPGFRTSHMSKIRSTRKAGSSWSGS
jgi:hypothetical protein